MADENEAEAGNEQLGWAGVDGKQIAGMDALLDQRYQSATRIPQDKAIVAV